MNNETNNIDDLLDDSIGRSLSELGFLFPKTETDFKKIENEIKNSKMPQLDQLQDPYTFLSKRSYNKKQFFVGYNSQDSYGQSLAQAAREGNLISEELKRKMAEDKLKANQKKKEN